MNQLGKMKTCRKCGETKSLDAFSKDKIKKDGLKTRCKLCVKAYHEANKEKIKAYRKANKEKILERKKAFRKANKEKIRAEKKAYYAANKAKIFAKARQRYKRDVQHRLASNMRCRLGAAIKNQKKTGSAVRDLGCTISELKRHLEAQFTEGMSWENWAHDGWHIDHIKPLASFDLTDRKQLLEACHYTNLQPLWAKENLSKGAAIINQTVTP